MDGIEFLEWIAYVDLGDPLLDLLAEQKADMRTGVIGATLANCLSTGKKKFAPSDFTPKWEAPEDKPKQTAADMKKAARRIAAAFRQRKA